MFSSEYGQPQVQPKQNIRVTFTYQDNSVTAFAFQRRLKANCNNPQELDLSTQVPGMMIYAIGASNTFSQHPTGNYGQKSIDLGGQFKAKANSSVLTDPEYTKLDIIADPVNVPVQQTAYCYSIFDFSNLTMSHIAAIEPIVNSPYVHHFIGYSCPNDPRPARNLSYGGQSSCNRSGKYRSNAGGCTTFYLLWGKGGKAVLIFPFPLPTCFLIILNLLFVSF
jgi:hypothetical protein